MEDNKTGMDFVIQPTAGLQRRYAGIEEFQLLL